MKYNYAVIAIALTSILFFRCITGNSVTYYIPSSYSEEKRKETIALFYKGEELYKTNCSGCHGIFSKGKSQVPDFSTEQLDNYSARYMQGDPKNHAIARQMSPDQLNNVLIFLHYKKMTRDTTTSTKINQ